MEHSEQKYLLSVPFVSKFFHWNEITFSFTLISDWLFRKRFVKGEQITLVMVQANTHTAFMTSLRRTPLLRGHCFGLNEVRFNRRFNCSTDE